MVKYCTYIRQEMKLNINEFDTTFLQETEEGSDAYFYWIRFKI